MKFVIIALGIIVVMKLVRRARGRRGSCRGHSRSRGGWRRPSWRWVDHLERHLDLSPEQSDIVHEQVKLMRARARSLEVPTTTRNRLAAVMRSESFDENILGELFIEHDDAMRTMRLEAVERLAAVHDALDPSQREKLAELLERGRGRFAGGPYRGR